MYNLWSDQAYDFLKDYINDIDNPNYEFMGEDIRVASEREIPTPSNKRAWGGVMLRAKQAGLIEKVGFSRVKNFKAHSTPATVWRVSNKQC